ncbi:MAG: hypothetical protein V9G14_17805 [Cypionkella sp.]
MSAVSGKMAGDAEVVLRGAVAAVSAATSTPGPRAAPAVLWRAYAAPAIESLGVVAVRADERGAIATA